MDLYVYWLIAALVLVVVEMLTSGFAVICFAIGALFAAIVALCGLDLNWQLVAMVVFTVLAFVLVRPFVLKYLNKKKHDVAMNVDGLINRIGFVSETIDGTVGTGRVAIDGDDWKAMAKENGIIEKGTRVKIVAHDSLIVTVEPCD